MDTETVRVLNRVGICVHRMHKNIATECKKPALQRRLCAELFTQQLAF
jgi:arginine deiminase